MFAAVDPESMTLSNPAFADIVVVILAGILLVWCVIDLLRGKW